MGGAEEKIVVKQSSLDKIQRRYCNASIQTLPHRESFSIYKKSWPSHLTWTLLKQTFTTTTKPKKLCTEFYKMYSWFPLWCALSLNVSGKKKHWKRCVCVKKRHRVEITWRLQRSTLNCRLGESSYKRDRVFPVNAKKQSSFSLFSQGCAVQTMSLPLT